MACLLSTPVRRLGKNEEGNVIILVGMVAFLLIMAVGCAVDMTRAQILQQRMSASLDAAGLAAAEDISAPPATFCPPPVTFTCSTAWANSEASRYFFANFPQGYLGSAVTAPLVTPSTDLNTLSLTVSGTQQPVFMQTFGFSTLNVSAQSQITRSNNGLGMEVVMALDNTESMNYPLPSQSESKIAALQSAADELVTILFGTGAPPPNFFIGLVPFTEAVNVGTGTAASLSSSIFDPTDPALPYFNSQVVWSGCVTERSTALTDANGLSYDISDIVPSSSTSGSLFRTYFFAPSAYYAIPGESEPTYTPVFTPPASGLDGPATGNANCSSDPSQLCYWNQWQTGLTTYNFDFFPGSSTTTMGPNVSCPQPVTPMTQNTTTILNGISSMQPTGDTEINVGLAWAYRMLSPTWRGLWQEDMTTYSLPLDYNTPNMIKVVILMTDGTNFVQQGDYSAYGFFNHGGLGSGLTTAPDVPGCDNSDGDCMQAASLDLDNRTAALCESMKNNHGIIIFTIGFGNPAPDNPPTVTDREDPTQVDTTLLSNCAGGVGGGITGQYFPAATNEQLQEAFGAIGNALENIRISK